jgi:hypothetical protein
LDRYAVEVDKDLGDEDMVLIVDGSNFLDSVGVYAWYMAEVPTNTQVWLQLPHTEVPAWSDYGRKPTRVRMVEGEPESKAVTLVAGLRWPIESCYEEGKQELDLVLYPGFAKDLMNRITDIQIILDEAGILKRDFSDKLTFHSAIDTQQILLFGTPDEVRVETDRII